jgi:hypothetical protein
MTGSGLGRYAETGQPPGFGGDGWGPGLPVPELAVSRLESYFP